MKEMKRGKERGREQGERDGGLGGGGEQKKRMKKKTKKGDKKLEKVCRTETAATSHLRQECRDNPLISPSPFIFFLASLH